MGLFDTVVIEGLKLKEPKEISSYLKKNNAEFPTKFQTKDLANALLTFKIDKKGQIFEELKEPTGKKVPYTPFNFTQDRPFLEKLYYKFQDYKLDKKYPNSRYINDYKTVIKKSSLTETFDIYSFEEVQGRYVELTYTVTAVKGKVANIKLKKHDIESEKSALDRKKDQEEFEKNISIEFQKQKEFRSKWYYSLIRETYNPFVFFSRKIIQSICDWITKNLVHWHGV